MQISEFDVWFMYRSGRGTDMVYDELTILAIFALQAIVLMWQIRLKKDLLMQDFEEILAGAVDDLDGRLAQALGAIAENIGLGDMERPNPFQQLLAQFLQAKINESQLNNVIKGEDGKFKSLKDEILDND
jgi:hypothetical protein